MIDPFNWTCPHCSRPQTVTDSNRQAERNFLHRIKHVDIGTHLVAIECLNDQCKKLTLTIGLYEWPTRHRAGGDMLGDLIQMWRLIPQSTAVPQPSFIPEPLRADYYEACAIRELSPKASSALSRRCLQGMIRDFCKIAKNTLDAEIKTLRTAVEQNIATPGVTLESVDAIDQVRSIGNIGAHMEKDISLIIEVDPGEAEALTGLIEMLFEEWYVARHTRQQRLAEIAAIAADKKAKIAEGRAALAKKAADGQSE